MRGSGALLEGPAGPGRGERGPLGPGGAGQRRRPARGAPPCLLRERRGGAAIAPPPAARTAGLFFSCITVRLEPSRQGRGLPSRPLGRGKEKESEIAAALSV